MEPDIQMESPSGPHPEKRKRRITDIENASFSHPSTSAANTMNTSQSLKLRTVNRYATLKNEEFVMYEEDEMMEPSEKKTDQKPPPIVIHGIISDHRHIVELLKTLCRGKFHIKYGRNSTILFIEKLEEYHLVKKHFKQTDQDFHSFTLKDEKTHAC